MILIYTHTEKRTEEREIKVSYRERMAKVIIVVVVLEVGQFFRGFINQFDWSAGFGIASVYLLSIPLRLKPA